MSKKESNPGPPKGIKKPVPPPAPPKKKFKTPFMQGDRQQNTYALASRLAYYFTHQPNRVDNPNIEMRAKLLRDLIEFAINEYCHTPWMEEILHDLLVNYLSNMEADDIWDRYQNFLAYNRGEVDSPLEVLPFAELFNFDKD